MNQGRPTLGLTDTETVMIDFDNTTLGTVKYWSRRTMRRFKLKGFIILKSSESCYHAIFDQRVSWAENMSIVAWTALHSNNNNMRKWFLMQCIKRESTLRVSPKGRKPSPRIVHRKSEQEGQIKGFLRKRAQIKRIMKKLNS